MSAIRLPAPRSQLVKLATLRPGQRFKAPGLGASGKRGEGLVIGNGPNTGVFIALRRLVKFGRAWKERWGEFTEPIEWSGEVRVEPVGTPVTLPEKRPTMPAEGRASRASRSGP